MLTADAALEQAFNEKATAFPDRPGDLLEALAKYSYTAFNTER